MERREFIRKLGPATALMTAGAWAFRCGKNGGRPLNVILINVDDLGWTDLSCYGSMYYETPRIDELAARGRRFTQAYAACAVCSPTRAAIMTGRYPARIGVTDWIHHLDEEGMEAASAGRNPAEYVSSPYGSLLCPPNPYWMELDEITVAEVFREAGYVTGHVGKWHLGYENWFPDKQGFDFNFGGTEIGQPPTYFDPYYLNESRPGISTLPPRKEGEYLTDRESDEAIDFIRMNRDRPFFLNMCHYAVHTPLQAKADIRAKYENKAQTHQDNAVYAAMIESVDQAVGRLMDVLQELDLQDKTAVVFTSDNGGLLGYATDNRPLRSGKGYPYEGGIRVPLIIAWPGMSSGGSCDVPVCSIDLLPTMIRAAGSIRPPRKVDGMNILDLVRGGGRFRDRDLFWHFPHYRARDIGPYSIIRHGAWKLIKWYEGPRYELYNLEEDLSETRDLSGSMPEKVRFLDLRLTRWTEETGARLPRFPGME